MEAKGKFDLMATHWPMTAPTIKLHWMEFSGS
jgi:hypothetical protein